MDGIVKPGRFFFAVAVAALGVEHITCGWFGVFNKTAFPGATVVSVILWVPAHSWLAYLTGVALLAAGLRIAVNARSLLAAILLGVLFLLFVVFVESPRLIQFGARTAFFETLAIGAWALTLAGTLPTEGYRSERWNKPLGLLVRSGRYRFAISSIVFGIDHLLYLSFVATLVPTWIPWHLFWAYFTGFAFIAAGLNIGSTILARWAGVLLGIMFLLWFVILHLLRSLGLSAGSGVGAPRNPNEWSSAFIALGLAGGAWISASQFLQSQARTTRDRISPRTKAQVIPDVDEPTLPPDPVDTDLVRH